MGILTALGSEDGYLKMCEAFVKQVQTHFGGDEPTEDEIKKTEESKKPPNRFEKPSLKKVEAGDKSNASVKARVKTQPEKPQLKKVAPPAPVEPGVKKSNKLPVMPTLKKVASPPSQSPRIARKRTPSSSEPPPSPSVVKAVEKEKKIVVCEDVVAPVAVEEQQHVPDAPSVVDNNNNSNYNNNNN